MNEIKITAPAKINLYLAVTAKEDNGYHTVENVMQAISLSDTVTVTITADTEPQITLSCDREGVPCDQTNLAWRAAEAFFAHTGKSFPIRIRIEKHIPVAGGLAGGSTDAAAVLVALNDLSAKPVSQDELLSMGAALGADVPFCILACLGHHAALGLHYGEQMTVCPPTERLHLVIASSGEAVSTPWAYAQIDASPYTAKGGYLPLLRALDARDTDRVLSSLYNGFASVILPKRPHAAQLHALLCEKNADMVMMSGSGPTVIGFFRDAKAAQCAVSSLCANGVTATLAETLP